jgi:hypothetical protein
MVDMIAKNEEEAPQVFYLALDLAALTLKLDR